MKHLKVFLVLMLMVIMTGCSSVKVDGDITDTEAALVRTAVGSAFLVQPNLVGPSFVVSDTILSNITGQGTIADTLNGLVMNELEGTSYTQAERQSVLDLFNLAVVSVYEDISLDELDIEERTQAIIKILEIIRASAEARL